MAIFPGQPVLLKLSMMEVMVTTGAITRAKLQSNRRHQKTNTQLFTGPSCRPTNSMKAMKGYLQTFCANDAQMIVVLYWFDSDIIYCPVLDLPVVNIWLQVKVHALDIVPLRSETPPQKCSGMARVLKGSHRFTCTPTCSSAIGMSHTWLPVMSNVSDIHNVRLTSWQICCTSCDSTLTNCVVKFFMVRYNSVNLSARRVITVAFTIIHLEWSRTKVLVLIIHCVS